MTSLVHKTLYSADEAAIYADAVGDPAKPHVLFLHGATFSGAVWDNIFEDPQYNTALYLVRRNPFALSVILSGLSLAGEIRYARARSVRTARK